MRTVWTLLRLFPQLLLDLFLYGWEYTSRHYRLDYAMAPGGYPLPGDPPEGVRYPTGPGVPPGTVYLSPEKDKAWIIMGDGSLRSIKPVIAGAVLRRQRRDHRKRRIAYALVGLLYLAIPLGVVLWIILSF